VVLLALAVGIVRVSEFHVSLWDAASRGTVSLSRYDAFNALFHTGSSPDEPKGFTLTRASDRRRDHWYFAAIAIPKFANTKKGVSRVDEVGSAQPDYR